MKKRKTYKGILNHCCQRLKDKGVIFYTVSDHLVYFTIFCTIAPRHRIRVLKLVQMPDHLHHGIIEDRKGAMSDFLRDCTKTFSREHNRICHRSGPLFEQPFLSVPKQGDKAARTNLIYQDNNPVERRLVEKAEDYRWNYLAYGASDHPFSDKIVLNKASMPLRRALKQVKALHESRRYLTYELLQKLFASLPDLQERYQLIDYIISTYSIIDHKASHRFFDGYKNEIIAAHSNTGSEYDLNEVFIGKDDRYYAKMTRLLLDTGQFKDIHEIISLSTDRKWELYQLLRRRTDAHSAQIASFLHMPIKIHRNGVEVTI